MVLLGDLNAAIDAPELRSLAATFTDAFAAVGIAAGRRATAFVRSPADRSHLGRVGRRVDDCRVVTEAGDASDHLPVVATLRSEVG